MFFFGKMSLAHTHIEDMYLVIIIHQNVNTVIDGQSDVVWKIAAMLPLLLPLQLYAGGV